jgi:hypothetical protein
MCRLKMQIRLTFAPSPPTARFSRKRMEKTFLCLSFGRPQVRMLRVRLGAQRRLASWPALQTLQPGVCARSFTSYDQPFIRVSRHTKDDTDLQRR